MKRKHASTLDLLASRETNGRLAPSRDLHKYAEDKAAHMEYEEMLCKLPVSVRSTFLMCFSPNGARVASTHGDHKIYVCQVSTGKLLKTLEGHPRTPWCLAFHPTSNDLLASGCLGGEVRVWDLKGGGNEVWVCPEKSVITSLSFHPIENLIALSTMNRVHFWDWSRPEPFVTTKTNHDREKVRMVRFSPGGDYLLTGIVNSSSTNSYDRPCYGQHRHRSSILSRLMTMYHRLGEMLPSSPPPRSTQRRMARRGGVGRFSQEELLEMARNRSELHRAQRALSRSTPYARSSETIPPMEDPSNEDVGSRPTSYSRNLDTIPPIEDSGTEDVDPQPSSSTQQRGSRSYLPNRPFMRFSEALDLSPRPEFLTGLREFPARNLMSNPTSSRSSSHLAGPSPALDAQSMHSAASSSSASSSSASSASTAAQPPTSGRTNPATGDNAELWDTFNRLRLLCTRLENRMMRHSSDYSSGDAETNPSNSSSTPATNPGPSATPGPSSSPFSRVLLNPGTSSSSNMASTSASSSANLSSPHNDSQSEISLSLVSLLSRLQESLQSLSDATALSGWNGDGAAARRQIREVRSRISEILERLENVSGYRERLRSLREQIYQAAARMARRGEDEPYNDMSNGSQQWDLAYCLWLVEMSLQLTNQMQRILTADYRLSRLHLRGTRSTSGAPRPRRPRLDDQPPLALPNEFPPHPLSFDSSSGSDSEGEPEVGPFSPPSFRSFSQYGPNIRYAGGSPLSQMNTVTHRVQYWKIDNGSIIPQISDPNSRLVVSRCKIHNDGSVDVSPNGRLLAALVPDNAGVTLSVFSLEEASIGQLLYTWGFGPNAVSVSFSPLSRYIVVGLASSRYLSPQREVVAQILRLGERPKQGQTGGVLMEHVGNMSQPLVGTGSSQVISLNCVRWLPKSGEGLVYGTNRGTLCICRPLCVVCPDCSDEQSENQSSTRRDSLFQNLSAQIEESATRHALLTRSDPAT